VRKIIHTESFASNISNSHFISIPVNGQMLHDVYVDFEDAVAGKVFVAVFLRDDSGTGRKYETLLFKGWTSRPVTHLPTLHYDKKDVSLSGLLDPVLLVEVFNATGSTVTLTFTVRVS